MNRSTISKHATFEQFAKLANDANFSDLVEDFTGQENKETKVQKLFTLFDALNKESINRRLLEQYRNNFDNNYAPEHVLNQPWAADIVIKWTTFQAAALGTLTPEQISNLALRFIHCYDTTNGTWYLTVQRLFMNFTSPSDPNTGKVYNLSAPNPPIFSIVQSAAADGIISPVTTTIDTDADGNLYQADYFDSVLYQANALDLTKNVHSITFPWDEFVRLFHANSTTLSGVARVEDSFNIVFCSISYDMADDRTSSLVEWPHTIAMYLTYQNSELLTDDVMTINKACNLGGACPPRNMQLIYAL